MAKNIEGVPNFDDEIVRTAVVEVMATTFNYCEFLAQEITNNHIWP